MVVARRTRRPRVLDSATENIGSAGSPPRLLVLQSCPVTPAGVVGEVAQARGAQLTTIFLHRGDPMPRSTAGFDGMIILGGPMHAGDDANYPAFPALLALIRRFHAQGKPIFGICLCAQLIARAFGKTVYRFGGCEVGYLPVSITAEGANDPLLAGLAREQRIMQMHEDSFDLPARRAADAQRHVCESGLPPGPHHLRLPVPSRSHGDRRPQLPARLLARPAAPFRRTGRGRGGPRHRRGRGALRDGRAFLPHGDRVLARPRRRLPRRRKRAA